MSRRIRWIGVVLILCFGLVIVQLVNIQFRKANALADNPNNPRNLTVRYDNDRGEILAANGEPLAISTPISNPKPGSYEYTRSYPQGPLFAGITGYASLIYGTAGIEFEYNNDLRVHTQPAQTFLQAIGIDPRPKGTDSVILTVEPALQQVAANALAGRDGAVVVENVHTGAILAMYSNPTYDPNQLASPDAVTEAAAYKAINTPDANHFSPAVPVATGEPLAPGSTFKVVTTAAVYNLDPSLANYVWPNPSQPGAPPCPPNATVCGCTALPDTNKTICNDADTASLASPCGGTIAEMLPPSCDPGYASLGLKLGGATLYEQASLLGYNHDPPIDLPKNMLNPSVFPTPAEFAPSGRWGLPGPAYAAFGQESVTTTALQNAMTAAAIADGGTVMTPHLMSEIRDSQGNVVETYKPTVYKQAMSPQAAAQIVPLMQAVATACPGATACGVFPPGWDVAVKTGTAQTGLNPPSNHAWMIGFAPATHPQIAVAVVVPYEPESVYGATAAGPIVCEMFQAALGFPGTCPGT